MSGVSWRLRLLLFGDAVAVVGPEGRGALDFVRRHFPIRVKREVDVRVGTAAVGHHGDVGNGVIGRKVIPAVRHTFGLGVRIVAVPSHALGPRFGGVSAAGAGVGELGVERERLAGVWIVVELESTAVVHGGVPLAREALAIPIEAQGVSGDSVIREGDLEVHHPSFEENDGVARTDADEEAGGNLLFRESRRFRIDRRDAASGDEERNERKNESGSVPHDELQMLLRNFGPGDSGRLFDARVFTQALTEVK